MFFVFAFHRRKVQDLSACPGVLGAGVYSSLFPGGFFSAIEKKISSSDMAFGHSKEPVLSLHYSTAFFELVYTDITVFYP